MKARFRLLGSLVLCAAVLASACSNDGSSTASTTTLPKELAGEMGRKETRPLASGADLGGRGWEMLTYQTPNNRVCIEVRLSDVSSTEFRGLCDETLFDLSLGRVQWSGYENLEHGIIFGVVAEHVGELQFFDSDEKVALGPLVPVPDSADDLKIKAFATAAPNGSVAIVALYSAGEIVERIPIASP